MPDEALMLGLEGLREVYIQKQKAASALLTGIKNVTAALNKANRALQGFTQQDSLFDDERLNHAQEGLESAWSAKEEALDALLPDLSQEEKRLTAITKALREALNALRSQPVDVVRLDHAYTDLQANGEQDGVLDELMPALTGELDLAQQQLGSIFGGALRSALAEMGIEVGGQPPRFELGCFEMEANFVTRKASLRYGKTEVAQQIPLSLEAVVKAYQREAKSIEGRTEDGPAWIKDFYEAWQRARQKRGTGSARVNVVDCYYEMVMGRQSRTFNLDPSKHAFKDYSRAQFLYDLVEFGQRQRLGYDGQYVEVHVATKSQAENPSKRFMWMVIGRHPHDGNYIADIEFKRD